MALGRRGVPGQVRDPPLPRPVRPVPEFHRVPPCRGHGKRRAQLRPAPDGAGGDGPAGPVKTGGTWKGIPQ